MRRQRLRLIDTTVDYDYAMSCSQWRLLIVAALVLCIAAAWSSRSLQLWRCSVGVAEPCSKGDADQRSDSPPLSAAVWPRTTAAAEVAAGHSSFGAAVLELLFEAVIVGTFGVRARAAAAAEVPAGHCSIGAAVTESLFEAVIVGTLGVTVMESPISAALSPRSCLSWQLWCRGDDLVLQRWVAALALPRWGFGAAGLYMRAACPCSFGVAATDCSLDASAQPSNVGSLRR